MSDRIWQAQYGKGIPSQIDPERYASLLDLFKHRVTETAAAPAFTNQGTTLSFGEIDSLSRRHQPVNSSNLP